ncbi:hypothetical protein Poli38472_002616 [Pythium oligandrum]|uniref:Multidrug and toxic compound extrusion protein n=1 Tax=Pythium oligandrum TaxID=41045 RepID=A0A8K1FH98_PYTOL|nr:hypothetical protein Poli38472_002616 [Pythium oligandrum]|eukprot:TMW63675.1 hypothetical protein Poli38472_002616 [Pythium oligandrum]
MRPSSDTKRKASEKTPLLPAANEVLADVDAYLKALALQLTEEEQKAVQLDTHAPAMDIVKDEVKRTMTLFVPLILTIVMEQLPDNITMMMIGHSDPEHSTEILAAMGLAGLFQMLFVSGVTNGLGAALDTVCSQAFGGKRYVEMWLAAQAGVIMSAIIVPILAVIFLNGAVILRALGQDPSIAETAWMFLFLITLSLPLNLIFVVQKCVLHAQNITVPLAVASALSYVVSLPAAYALGFWTPLGYFGIAASAIINCLVKVLVLIPVIMRNPVYRDSWPGWKPREAAKMLSKISRLGFSSMLMVTFQLLGFPMVSTLVGYLPNPAVAITANSIFIQVVVFSIAPMTAFCIAGTIRMGNALGAGQSRRAALTSRVIVALCAATALVGMIVVLVAANPLTRAFTTDPDAVEVTTGLLHHVGIVIPLLGITYGIQSIFRACGEQWLCAKLNFVFVLALGGPLGMLFATQLNGGITGLWVGNCLSALGFILGAGVWLYRISWDEMAHNARINTHLADPATKA